MATHGHQPREEHLELWPWGLLQAPLHYQTTQYEGRFEELRANRRQAADNQAANDECLTVTVTVTLTNGCRGGGVKTAQGDKSQFNVESVLGAHIVIQPLLYSPVGLQSCCAAAALQLGA